MRIFVSGTVAYDRIMAFSGKFSDSILPEQINHLSVSFAVEKMTEAFGGTAGNIAYTLALLGLRPLILSSVGTDFSRYESWLAKHKLPLDGLRRVPDIFSACAHIITDRQNSQFTAFYLGAAGFPCNYNFKHTDTKNSIAIVAPGNTGDMVNLCRVYRERGIPYICDPSQQIPVLSGEKLTEMITGAAVLISNGYELDMIVKSTGLNMKSILQRTDAVVTTLGEDGTVVRTPSDTFEIPAVSPKEVKDPTGAGDAFRGGFILGMVQGKAPADCAKMGAVTASFCLETVGTQTHHFTMDEFEKRLSIPV